MIDLDIVSRTQVRMSLEGLFKNTNVKGISYEMSVPDDLRREVRDELLSRKRNSWFDEQTGNVCLYLPNIMDSDLGFLHSSILFSVVEHNGLEGLFKSPEEAVKVFSKALRREFDSLSEVEKYISQNRLSGAAQISIARELASYLEMEHYEPGAKRAVVGALSSYWKLRDADSRRLGDFSSDDEFIRQRISRYLDDGENSFIVIGYSDVFLGDALGFGSEAPVFGMDVRDLVEQLKKSGVSEDVILNTPWASVFNDPLAVVRDPHGNMPFRYSIILNMPVRGDFGEQLVSFKVNSPESFAAFRKERGFDRGTGHYHLGAFTFSYSKIARMLSAGKENWLYMRPTKYGNSQFELVNRIEDRALKGGTLPAPGFNVSGLRAEFLHIAKIASFFENPKTREEKKKNFETLMKQLDRMDAETLESASQRTSTVSERDMKLQMRFTEKDLGKGSFAKLNRAGVFTAGDLINIGFDRVFEITESPRAVNKAAAFLYSKGFICVPKEQMQPVSSMPLRGDDGRHFVDCVKAFFNKDMAVYMPQRLDGSLFQGGDTLHLIAAKALEKRSALPVWLSASELAAYGCEVGKAMPVPVHGAGGSDDLENVYNISETTFPKVHKEEYQLMKEAFSERVISGWESVAAKRLLWDINSDFIESDNMCKVIEHFNSDGVNSLKSLMLSGGLPLSDIVGENTVKQMERKGKSVNMYKALKRFSSPSVKRSKGR